MIDEIRREYAIVLHSKTGKALALRAIHAIVDDLLQATGHREDCRMKINDTEIMTSALVAAKFFGGNQEQACRYLQEEDLIHQMLSKSRFCRLFNDN